MREIKKEGRGKKRGAQTTEKRKKSINNIAFLIKNVFILVLAPHQTSRSSAAELFGAGTLYWAGGMKQKVRADIVRLPAHVLQIAG